MRYEFIHDSIAKQVFYKAGAEARTRRKVEKYIREHYEAFEERGAELNDDDIDYIKPYLGLVNISPEQAQFVRQGERKLQRKRLRRRILTAGIIAVLFIATVVSLFFLRRATVAEGLADARAQKIGLQRDSIAQQEKDLKQSLETTEVARDSARTAYLTADTLRLEAEAAELLAQMEAARARRAEADAKRRAREAQSLALAATARSIEDELPTTALKLAQVAYGVIPQSPLPSVAQTLSALFYEQFPDGDGQDPGAPLFKAALPYDAQQFDGRNPDSRRRSPPTWSDDSRHYLLPLAPGTIGLYDREGKSIATLTHDVAPYAAGVLIRNGARGVIKTDTLRSQVPPVDAAAWSPAGDRFATGDEAGTINIWNTRGERLASGGLPDWVSKLRFSPDGRYLYAWSNAFTVSSPEAGLYSELPSSRNLWIWDTQDGRPADSGLLAGFLTELHFAPDGRSFILPTGQYQLDGKEQFSFAVEGEGNGRALQYSATGHAALVKYNGGVFRLWDLRRQEAVLTLGGGEDPIRIAVLAPEGNTVLAFHESKIAGLYAPGGRLLSELPPDDYLRGAIAPGGNFLTAGTAERDIVWTPRNESLIVLTEEVNPDIAPLFTADGQLFFMDGPQQLARWRNRVGTQPLEDLHDENVRGLSLDPSGRWLLSRDESGTAYLWTTAGAVRSRFDKQRAYIEHAVFSPTGDALLTADRRGSALLWEVDQSELVRQLAAEGDRIDNIMAIPYSADFITVTRNGQYAIRSWDGDGTTPLVNSRRQNVKLAISPDGRLIATQIGNRSVSIWDRATGVEKATIDPGLTQLNDLTFRADSRWLMGVAEDGQVWAWSIDGKIEKSWPGDTKAAGLIKVAPSQGYLFTNPGYAAFKPSSNTSFTLPLLSEFSPTGGYFVADQSFVPPLFRVRSRGGSAPELERVPLEIVSLVPSDEDTGSGVRVWGTNGTLRQKITFPANTRPYRIDFSPDGGLFAVELYRSGTVVYDSLGRLSALNRSLRGPQYVIFSPDNRHLLATYGTNIARVFDRGGRLVGELNQLNETVQAAEFTPDGRQILLTGVGKVAQLYNPEGQLLASFDRHGANLESAIFTEDGQFVVTFDRSGILRRYPVPDRIYAWLRETGRLPGLTEAQRSRYGLTEFQLQKGD